MIVQWKLQNPVWVLQAFFGRNLQFTGFCSAVLMTAYQITDFQSAVICSLPVFAVPEFEVSTVLWMCCVSSQLKYFCTFCSVIWLHQRSDHPMPSGASRCEKSPGEILGPEKCFAPLQLVETTIFTKFLLFYAGGIFLQLS